MSRDFLLGLLGILPTILFTTITVWSSFESQDKHKEAKKYLISGMVVAFLYSLVLVVCYRLSISKLLTEMWVLLDSNAKWWQILLLLIIIFIANLISRRGIKITKVEEEKKEEEKEPVSTRKGKELPVFRWIGDKEDRVGKEALEPDGEKDGSFLLIPRRNGRIVSLDLRAINDDGSETGERWNTFPGPNWPLLVVDARTDEIVNKSKREDIERFVREETKLLIYAAKTDRGFRGKYKIKIGFARGKKQILQAVV